MQTKSTRSASETSEASFDEYDFGQPEVYSIDLDGSLVLSFREPTVSDFSEIEKYMEKELGNVELLTRVMCLLHVPDPGRQKITLKNASKIRGSQIKKISKVLMPLISLGEKDKEDKSELDEEL